MKAVYVKGAISGIVGLVIIFSLLFLITIVYMNTKSTTVAGQQYQSDDFVEGLTNGLELALSIAYSLLITGMFVAWWTKNERSSIWEGSYISLVSGSVMAFILFIIATSYEIMAGVKGPLLSLILVIAFVAIILLCIFSALIFAGFAMFSVFYGMSVALRSYTKKYIRHLMAPGVIIGLTVLGIILFLVVIRWNYASVLMMMDSGIVITVAGICGFITGWLNVSKNESDEVLIQGSISGLIIGFLLSFMLYFIIYLLSGNISINIIPIFLIFIVPNIFIGVVFGCMGSIFAHVLRGGKAHVSP